MGTRLTECVRLSTCFSDYTAEVALTGKPRSLDAARRSLDRVLSILGDIPVEELSPAHIRKLKARLREAQLKPVTINGFLKNLGAALRQAKVEGLIEQVPRIPLLKAPLPEPEALTAEEVARLVELNRSEPTWTMLLLLVSTGMRISELIHLDWADWEGGVLQISPKPAENWSPKNHQQRRVDLREAPQVLEAMELHRERERLRLGRAPRPSDPIFPNHHTRKGKKRYIQNKLSKHISAAFRFAGIKGTAHTLRRSHATIAKANGADLDTIRRTLGHSTLAVTERYFAADAAAQQRSIGGIAQALANSRGPNSRGTHSDSHQGQEAPLPGK